MKKDPTIAALFAEARDYRYPSLDNLPPKILQPKLNGLRALWIPERFAFFSRDGVMYHPDVTEHMIPPADIRHLPLDGELYRHGWSLQQINSAAGVNRNTPTPRTREVTFNVFDYISREPQWKRLEFIRDNVPNAVPFHLMSVPDDMESIFVNYLADGYEGVILRDTNMPYRAGRTGDIIKRKGWQDEDYLIVGVTNGKGKHADSIGSLVCALLDGTTFSVDGMEDADRDAWAQNPSLVIGRRAKVKFLTLSDDGIPLMPKLVGVVDGR